MGKSQRYIIPMRCRVKPRPRVTGSHTYMPKAYIDWRDLMQASLWHAGAKPMAGDVELALVIRFKGKGRGDADNLAGGVMDAGNGVLYNDDAQVQRLTVDIQRGTGSDEIEITLQECE